MVASGVETLTEDRPATVWRGGPGECEAFSAFAATPWLASRPDLWPGADHPKSYVPGQCARMPFHATEKPARSASRVESNRPHTRATKISAQARATFEPGHAKCEPVWKGNGSCPGEWCNDGEAVVIARGTGSIKPPPPWSTCQRCGRSRSASRYHG